MFALRETDTSPPIAIAAYGAGVTNMLWGINLTIVEL